MNHGLGDQALLTVWDRTVGRIGSRFTVYRGSGRCCQSKQQSCVKKVLLCLLLYVYVCVCLCPQEGVPEAFKCLYNITHGHNGSNVLAGTDTETLRRYCSEGLFNHSIKCVEDLFTECNNTKEMDVLRMVANPTLWRFGAQQLCGSLPLHAQYSDCIVRQRPLVQGCLQHNDFRFRQHMEQDPKTMRALIFNICRYYTGMKICTAHPISSQCDGQVGQDLELFIISIAPPVCTSGQSSNMPHASNSPQLQCNSAQCVTVAVFIWLAAYHWVTRPSAS